MSFTSIETCRVVEEYVMWAVHNKTVMLQGNVAPLDIEGQDK